LSAAGVLAQAETIYGLTATNQIFTFNSSTPGIVSPLLAVTGLQVNETLQGIDFRPKNGALYGLGDTSRLYRIDTMTGVATQIGPVFSTLLSGTAFGIDFNPVADRLRLHSDANQNLRINPITGAVAAVDADLVYAAGDPNFGQDPNIVAAAYTNNVANPVGGTTLYSLDSQWDNLNVHSGAPAFAMMNTVGSVPILNTNRVGFDISGVTGVAYVSVSPNTFTDFYTIDLTNGMTKLVGQIGTNLTVMNITAAPIPEPGTMALVGLALAGAAAWARRRMA
jgi:hypothetical protein